MVGMKLTERAASKDGAKKVILGALAGAVSWFIVTLLLGAELVFAAIGSGSFFLVFCLAGFIHHRFSHS